MPQNPISSYQVGYKARMLAEHIIEEGIASILYTEGRGNAWWISNTLLTHLDEPLVVLTCDNLVDLDFGKLYEDYKRVRSTRMHGSCRCSLFGGWKATIFSTTTTWSPCLTVAALLRSIAQAFKY